MSRIRADQILNSAGTGAPNFSQGLTGTTGTFSGNVSIGGTLTYEDVTSIDSVGIITARSGLNVTGGQLNVGSNIKIGNAGVITATSFSGDGSALTGIGGTANVSTNTLSVSGVSTFANAATFNDIPTPTDIPSADACHIYAYQDDLRLSAGSELQFYSDGFHRWTITSSGALETHATTYYNLGNSSDSGGRVGNGYFQTSVDLIDNGELRLGTGDDLKLYHDGTHSYITCDGGNLKIQSTNLDDIQILNDQETSIVKTDFSAYSAKFKPSTSVDLYYGGSKKFETTSTGVEVTGNITVNGENYPTSGSLSNRNKVINGAMNIAQRSTSQAVGAGYKTVDRFNVSFANGNVAQEQHALNSGDTGPWAQGFREAFRLTNTSTSTGPMSFREINYIMESQDVATMGWDYNNTNSFVTLSFWAKASVTQTYYLSLVNDDGAYMRTHPLALTAGVWKYFEIAIPGDSNLTFNMDNGVGLRIRFIPFYGIIYTGSVADNTWRSAAGPDYLPDMTNTWAGTTDATFDVTGVQFELGSKATPFEFRSTGDELLKCQRYFIRQDWALCNNIYGIAYRWIPPGPSVNMRTAPSMSYFNPNTGTANQTYEHSSGTARTINSSPAALSATSGSTIYFGTSTNGTYGQYVRVHMDAELS